jgi:hypothetical protein
MESQTSHSSKAQKLLNRKQDYMQIGGRNEEGKHRIECSVNKDPLNLMNQQILEYKQWLMGKIQQILCYLGIHKSLTAFDSQIYNIFK